MDCARTAISITISEQPIAWGESQVVLVALFALSPTGRQVFRDVLDGFIALLADPVTIHQILTESHDFASFMEIISRNLPASGALG